MVLLAALSIGGSLIITPILMTLICVTFLASIGKSFGVRRIYIKLLLKIFEYGRQNIENVKRISRNESFENIDADDENDDNNDCENINDDHNNNINNGSDNKTIYINKLLNNNINNNSNNNNIKSNGHINKANGKTNVISRDKLILVPEIEDVKYTKKLDDLEQNGHIDFQLENCLDYIKAGVEAIIEDEVTSRFEAEELKNWNLLTRTNRYYEFISWRLSVIWVFGFFVRYIVLMPLRVFICFVGVAWAVGPLTCVGFIPFKRLRRRANEFAFKILFRFITRSVSGLITFHNLEYRPKNCGFCVANHTTPIDIAILSTDCTFSLVIWLTLCTAVVGCIAEGDQKRSIVRNVLIQCFGVLSSALSSVINYHNIQNRPNGPGICVANHTSPIDALVLMCDNCYSLIGQRHGGFLGILQRALGRASPHIWFERAESKDRHAVANRLKQHVSDPKNPPILIFPEGTCINNTSVMQFKKGSFEVGGVIYPVAIKYDPRFGDPFWNSSKYSYLQYLFLMMTSWAIVCDVWYLPPMYRQENESAIEFANRVKSVIAKQGGLIDLAWDGNLKRNKAKSEWKEKQQEEFTKRLKGE